MKRVLTTMLTVTAIASLVLTSCSKKDDGGGGDPGGVDPTKPPVDPPVAKTIGFFLDDWQSRSFSTPQSTTVTMATGPASATLSIDPYKIISKVPSSLFGENANVFTTQFVNEPVLMENINKLNPTFIRYPGGDNSSTFFWNATAGALPPDVPTTLVDKDGGTFIPKYSYGNSTATNTLSLENYYNLVQQTGSKGIISINYAYARYSTAANPVAAAAQLAADWVRHDNGRTKYWEIGNENFGNWQAGYRINTANNKDGQPEIINGDVYGDHFNIIADAMKAAAAEKGKTILIGAVLVEGRYTSSTPTEIDWNVKTIKKVHSKADFYSVHNFYTPFGADSDAPYILYSSENSSKLMAEYVNQAFKSAGVDAKPIAMTEYNINAINKQQGPSFVSGMHAISTLGEILKNNIGMAARFGLTDIWNNGNTFGLFNIGDEPGGVAKWEPRPAFYYMHYFRRFLGDRLVTTSFDKSSPEVLSYASTFSSGHVGLTLINKSEIETKIKVELKHWKAGSKVYWYTLTGGTDNGQFSRKVLVNGTGPTGVAGGPADFQSIAANSADTKDGIFITLPKRSTVMLAFESVRPAQ